MMKKRGVIVSNNDIFNLIYLIKNGNNESVQECINSLKGRVTLPEYNSIIDVIFEKMNLRNEETLKKIFNQKPQFNIKTYKELLKMEASIKFNKLKEQKSSVFVSLSKNICDDLAKKEVNDIIEKYNIELEYIKTVNLFSELVHLLRNYRENVLSCDQLRINESRSQIREFFRRFNLKYKENYLKKYCDKKIQKIQDDFEIKPKYEETIDLLSKDAFTKLILNDIHMTTTLKLKIKRIIDFEFENSDLKKIILNILNNKDLDNFKTLKINNNLTSIEEKLKNYDENKAFHRLSKNYTESINKIFNQEEKNILIEIFNTDNLKKYRTYFNNNKYSLINFLLIIYKEAKCSISLENDNIIFKKDDMLNNIEYPLLKEDIKYYKLYMSLKNTVLNYYYNVSENKKKIIKNEKISIEKNLIFDDDNYQIKNSISILNYELLIDILKKINYKKIRNYNEEQLSFLKKILYKEGLLGCVMKYESHIDISNIINGIDYCDFKEDIDIEKIIKLTSI